MLFSIGVDIIEIDRIKKASSSQSFLKKVFTDKELDLIENSTQSLAGNFAAKEAVAKAFGTGFKSISPKDIEILRNNAGKPFVVLYNNALKLKNKNKITNVHISISHNKTDAVAFAVMEV